MIEFWVGALVLILLASLFILMPFVRERHGARLSRSELNRHLYFLRRDELGEESARGLNDDPQAMLTELQSNLLDEVSSPEAGDRTSGLRLPGLVPAFVVLIIGSVTVYFSIGGLDAELDRKQAIADLTYLSPIILGGESMPSKEDHSRFAQGLRAKLQADPDESMGWLMLARSGLALSDLDMMLGAAEKAYALDPQSTAIRTIYAQALFYLRDPESMRQAEALLKQALADAPDDLDMLGLYAMMAFEASQFDLAIERWQVMLDLLPEDSSRAKMLRQTIDYSRRQLLAQSQALAPESSGSPEPIRYRIEVTLAPDVKLPANGTLFISVLSDDAAMMPIAARKMAAPEFPFVITLSDQDNLIPDLKLSEQTRFQVQVRLSADDSVKTSSGDWLGKSGLISQGYVNLISVNIDSAL